MGTLYLVRHGQASFGAADYDNLSDLGTAQSERLGQYWHAQGLQFDAVYTGTLRRHRQTLAGIATQLPGLPESHEREALNEYNGHALMRAVQPEGMPKPTTPELRRQHFRVLCDALAQWMAGVISPPDMPTWNAFSDGVRHTLEHIRQQHPDGNVLLVSSGGPISTAITQVLGTTPETSIALNMRLRNCTVTEFSISPKRLMLQTFNTVNHLDTPETRDWITHT